MITEDYVSFETAKLLKEKGFNEKCRALYTFWFDEVEGPTEDKAENWNIEPKYFSAPTLQMAMKWLREKDEILISVNPTIDKDGIICIMYYIWQLDDIDVEATKSGLYSIENYNNCINDAIKYCLENLI